MKKNKAQFCSLIVPKSQRLKSKPNNIYFNMIPPTKEKF